MTNPTGFKNLSGLILLDSRSKNYKFIPPETSMRCAFTQRASSVHKKATTPPISSGNPTLPKAVTEAIIRPPTWLLAPSQTLSVYWGFLPR